MVTQETLRKIEKDFDFEKLELHLNLPNIFRILRITKKDGISIWKTCRQERIMKFMRLLIDFGTKLRKWFF